MMNFTAIDFETATSARNSACSVAVVEVREGRVAQVYSTLIRPPEMKFNFFNIQVHGIHPEDVKEQPVFADIWPSLLPYLEGRQVVAHNAAFDMSVLRASLLAAGIRKPKFQYCCTVKLARRVWPEWENHKLDTAGRYLQVKFHHHDAAEDARVCAAIPVFAAKKQGIMDFTAMTQQLGIPWKMF